MRYQTALFITGLFIILAYEIYLWIIPLVRSKRCKCSNRSKTQ